MSESLTMEIAKRKSTPEKLKQLSLLIEKANVKAQYFEDPQKYIEIYEAQKTITNFYIEEWDEFDDLYVKYSDTEGFIKIYFDLLKLRKAHWNINNPYDGFDEIEDRLIKNNLLYVLSFLRFGISNDTFNKAYDYDISVMPNNPCLKFTKLIRFKFDQDTLNSIKDIAETYNFASAYKFLSETTKNISESIEYLSKAQDYDTIVDIVEDNYKNNHKKITDEQLMIKTLLKIPAEYHNKLSLKSLIIIKLANKELMEARMSVDYAPGNSGYQSVEDHWLSLVKNS